MTEFDPISIERYSVIRLPYNFSFGSRTKLFVVLGHRQDTEVCIKATSQVDAYLNNQEMRDGCVYYEAGETSHFTKDTAIQPDNQFPITHEHILACHHNRNFEDLGVLPRDFEEALKSAINNSITINKREKERVSKLLSS